MRTHRPTPCAKSPPHERFHRAECDRSAPCEPPATLLLPLRSAGETARSSSIDARQSHRSSSSCRWSFCGNKARRDHPPSECCPAFACRLPRSTMRHPRRPTPPQLPPRSTSIFHDQSAMPNRSQRDLPWWKILFPQKQSRPSLYPRPACRQSCDRTPATRSPPAPGRNNQMKNSARTTILASWKCKCHLPTDQTSRSPKDRRSGSWPHRHTSAEDPRESPDARQPWQRLRANSRETNRPTRRGFSTRDRTMKSIGGCCEQCVPPDLPTSQRCLPPW